MKIVNPLIKHTWMYSPSIIIGPSLRIDHPKLHHKPSHRWNISTRFASIWCIFIYHSKLFMRENFITKKVNHGFHRLDYSNIFFEISIFGSWAKPISGKFIHANHMSTYSVWMQTVWISFPEIGLAHALETCRVTQTDFWKTRPVFFRNLNLQGFELDRFLENSSIFGLVFQKSACPASGSVHTVWLNPSTFHFCWTWAFFCL